MGTPLALALLLFAAGPLWAAGSSPAREETSIGIKQYSRETQPTPEGNNALESVHPVKKEAQESRRSAAAKPRRRQSQSAIAERLAKTEPEKGEKTEAEKTPGAADEASAHFSGQRFYDGAEERPAQSLRSEAISGEPQDAAAAAAQPLQPDATPKGPQDAAAAAAQPEDVFVAVDLDLKANPEQYKDAVASLGRVAAFRPDPRFAPATPSPGRISFWGWMPVDRVSQALSVSGVLRLHLDQSKPWASSSVPNPAMGKFLVSIRVADEAGAAEAAQKVVEELAGFGFQPLRSAGAQSSAGGAVVGVEGLLPVRALSLVLGHAQVLKVAAAQGEPAAVSMAQGKPAARKKSSPRDFLRYATQRAPFLLVLTLLLLLLPRLAGGWEKLRGLFAPYRR